MFNERGSRIKLLSIATVAAAALVVGAWTMPAEAGGEETHYVTMNAQARMRTGDYCHANANFHNGTSPYTFTWTSTNLWNGTNVGTLSIRSAYLNVSGTAHLQRVDAWDAFDNHAFLEEYWEVAVDGDECMWSP